MLEQMIFFLLKTYRLDSLPAGEGRGEVIKSKNDN